MTAHGWLYLLVSLVGLWVALEAKSKRTRRHRGKKSSLRRRVRHPIGPRIATREQRRLIYLRDGGVCHYCALIGVTTKVHPRSYHRRGPWTSCYACGEIDHKHPHAKGGRTVLDNLVLSCWECNREKGTTPYEEFVRRRGRGSAHRPRARAI